MGSHALLLRVVVAMCIWIYVFSFEFLILLFKLKLTPALNFKNYLITWALHEFAVGFAA